MSAHDKNPFLQISEQLGELTGNLTKLFRLEIELAKTEIKESGRRVAEKGGLLLLGGALMLASLFSALGALTIGFSYLMPLWAAFLATSLLVAITGSATIYVGLKRIHALPVAPKFQSTMRLNKERLMEAA